MLAVSIVALIAVTVWLSSPPSLPRLAVEEPATLGAAGFIEPLRDEPRAVRRALESFEVPEP